jgi:hippurate hydrolase
MASVVVSAELLAETLATRGDLQAHSELAFEEKRTAALVFAALRGLGLSLHHGIGRTGVVGGLSGSFPVARDP